jgi:hypothetical protein
MASGVYATNVQMLTTSFASDVPPRVRRRGPVPDETSGAR